MPKRRAFLSLIFALVLAAGPAADAERYQNRSGLADGRFVWSPTVAPDGPVTIVASPGERIVHVYRSGQEIGISTLSSSDTSLSGVYLVPGRDQQSTDTRTWRGIELMPADESAADTQDPLRLPDDLAGLLAEATQQGASVIIARERSGPPVFSAPGPFVDPLETGSIDNPVARFAQPELRKLEVLTAASLQPDQANLAAAESGTPSGTGSDNLVSLVFSQADASAYVMRGGRVVERLPIEIEEADVPLGQHVAILISSGDEERETQWLAFALDDVATAEHVVADKAEAAMRRIRFRNGTDAARLAHGLVPGTAVLLVNGPGPDADRAPRLDVALLTSESAAASDPQMSQSAPPASAEADRSVPDPALSKNNIDQQSSGGHSGTGKPARKSTATTKSGSAAPAKRARGPLDHREAWPHSMYWPY